MPVPFRDAADLNRLGSAGFLRILPADAEDAVLGALFLVNAGGEPVEFTFNRLEVVQRFLWRAEDLHRHAARRLTASLFEICPRIPSVILALAEEARKNIAQGKAINAADIALFVASLHAASEELQTALAAAA